MCLVDQQPYWVYNSCTPEIKQISKMRSNSTRSLMAINHKESKEHERNYNFHIRKIMEIENTHHQNKFIEQQKKIADNLRRSKEIAKKFKDQQELTKRHHQDKKMILTLIEIHKKPRIKSEISLLQKRIESLPARSPPKQKFQQQEKISNENIRLAKSIMSSATVVKQYKRRMRTQIDEYLRLRKHVQKIKPLQCFPEKPRKPIKTADELLALIKQKTEEINRNRSTINITIAESSKEEDLTQKELELLG